MIDASFIKEVRAPQEATLLSANDKVYSNVKLVNLPPPEQYDFPTIRLRSLDSLVQYIADNRDKALNPGDNDVQIICGPDRVELVGPPLGELRKRDQLVVVEAEQFKHQFGQWQTVEDFRIYLLTHFDATESDRERILQFISSVKDEHIATSSDDGVSQTATVKAGLATLRSATVPSHVTLRPFRTFVELDQPASQFIFRMRSDKGLACALFEIQSTWKFRAAVSGQDYHEELAQLDGYTVLG